MCLKKAGIMHDHFPGENAAASDPSPVLSGSAAAGVYPYDRSYERGQLYMCAGCFRKAHGLQH